TPQEGLSTRGVSSPIEPRRLRLLCLSLVLCVASPLGGRYIYIPQRTNPKSVRSAIRSFDSSCVLCVSTAF
ncbi:hypothetical protein FXE48_08070, partial [Vibrio cholerae]